MKTTDYICSYTMRAHTDKNIHTFLINFSLNAYFLKFEMQFCPTIVNTQQYVL